MKIREISSTPLYRKDCKICYDHKCNYIPKSGNNGRYRKLSLIPAPGTQFLQLHRNHNALQRQGRISPQCNIPPCHLHNYVLFALSSDWWQYVFLLFYWQIFQIILPCLCLHPPLLHRCDAIVAGNETPGSSPEPVQSFAHCWRI